MSGKSANTIDAHGTPSAHLLRETEAAEILGLKVKTLRGWRLLGRGPRFVKVGGWAVRYALSDLAAFVAAQPAGGGE